MSSVDTLRAEKAVRDQDVLARMARGDTAAVADLYDQYGRLVFAVIVKIIKDAAVSEELMQEVFVRAWRSAPHYEPERGSVHAWLLAIAHNRAVDELRRRRKESGWISIDAISPDGLGSVVDDPGEPLLGRALEAVPAEQRQVIELAYFNGLTVLEIAARLELPPGTVKSRMRLALQKLRAYLGIGKDGQA
jgi:RNA polymerase sigma-70 factor (ECF subfamily)